LWAAVACAFPVTLELLSLDGPYVNGVPTYPYTLQIDVNSPFWGMCGDFYHGGAPGDMWQANLTNLGTGDLTYMRFASSGLVAYQEAAWIFMQTPITPQLQWTDMNYAVWHIFNPTVAIDQDAQSWIILAQKNIGGVDFSQVVIATPVYVNAPPIGDQEYLWFASNPNPPLSPVPEPGSLILVTTGVNGMGWLLHRKTRG
jgi:hypothetical protein